MLEHTVYLKEKQDMPEFIKPKWYTELIKVYRQEHSVIYAALYLGLPEAQVREATYDLWRMGEIVRRRVIDEKGQQYHYTTHHAAWNDDYHAWYDWQPDFHHAEALRVIERYAHPVTMHDIVFATGWTLDHTKRVINELWRARRLLRNRVKSIGKAWWYEYEVRK